MKSILCILIAVNIFCAGCATQYQANGITGGFRDIRLAPDIFRITFRGNGYTSADRVQDFALLRACELTLNYKFTCFAIIDQRASSTPFTVSTPATSTTSTYGSGNVSGRVYGNQFNGYAYINSTSYTTYTPGQTFTFFKPTSGLMIQVFPQKPENIPTFDAHFMLNEITNRYHLHLTSQN